MLGRSASAPFVGHVGPSRIVPPLHDPHPVGLLLRGATSATAFVSEITYNARGQRESIAYGNHTSAAYTYDADRFWLTRLLTARASASSHGAATLQDLGYTRDLVGNITGITDDAQETLFFANTQVSPDRTFTYDSLYRLVSATGREKVSQAQSTAWYANYAGAMGAIPDSGNPALRSYTQSYTYDAAGNLTEMKHQQGSGGAVLWRRGYAIASGNNQLLSSSRPGDDPDDPATHSDTYAHDARGAMVFLPHLKTGVSANLVRDFRDQLRKADLDSAGNVAWYAYDAGGQRVRKVWDKGSVVEERIYVGGYEVWRKKNGSGVVQEERQTLHVMDDQRRIAMVETLTVTGGSTVGTPTPRFRYQLDDHLGTALIELDDDGGVISYEEYHPYGTTAWWAEDGAIQVSRKRYRYTGKEKDEETGLYDHGHRYYLPWLGQWERPDPNGLGDGGNRWGYVGGRPVGSADPSGLAEMPASEIEKERLRQQGRQDPLGQRWDLQPRWPDGVDLEAIERELERSRGPGIRAQDPNAPRVDGIDEEDPRIVEGRRQLLGALNLPLSEVAGGVLGEKALGGLLWVASKTGAGDLVVAGWRWLRGARATTGGARSLDDGAYRGTEYLDDGLRAVDDGVGGASQGGATGFRGSRAVTPGHVVPTKPGQAIAKVGGELANAPYQPLRNADAVISGRTYGGHALDQMQNRGLMPSVVENAIGTGTRSADPIAGRFRYYDEANDITVVLEEEANRVITVMPGSR